MAQNDFPIREGMKKVKIEVEIPQGHVEFLTNFAKVLKKSIERCIEELVMDEIDNILDKCMDAMEGEDEAIKMDKGMLLAIVVAVFGSLVSISMPDRSHMPSGCCPKVR